MAVEPLFDISGINLEHTVVDRAGIEEINKHRYQAVQLDRVIWMKEDFTLAIGARRIRDDEWWHDGHIPGNPIFPGVLQVEAAAQLSSYIYQRRLKYTFVGFAAIDNTKFRRLVKPGDELIILCKELRFSPRIFITENQGLVNGELAFQTRITGMTIIR